MWTQSLDLHSHSLHSDGEHPVQDVARLMHEEGVQTWSLTDHDTTAGRNEAASAAASMGMRYLHGDEIT